MPEPPNRLIPATIFAGQGSQFSSRWLTQPDFGTGGQPSRWTQTMKNLCRIENTGCTRSLDRERPQALAAKKVALSRSVGAAAHLRLGRALPRAIARALLQNGILTPRPCQHRTPNSGVSKTSPYSYVKNSAGTFSTSSHLVAATTQRGSPPCAEDPALSGFERFKTASRTYIRGDHRPRERGSSSLEDKFRLNPAQLENVIKHAR